MNVLLNKGGIPCQVIPPFDGPGSDFDVFWYTLRSICDDLKKNQRKFFSDPPEKNLGGSKFKGPLKTRLTNTFISQLFINKFLCFKYQILDKSLFYEGKILEMPFSD